MNAKTSPYLLIFRDTSAKVYEEMSPEERQKLLQQWNAWYDGLVAAGKLQAGHPLEATGRIVTGASGRIVDGPFAEAKEAVGGFFLLNVSGLEEATEIAKQCPTLRHGLPFSVEVRPVAECCPALHESKTVETPELVNA